MSLVKQSQTIIVKYSTALTAVQVNLLDKISNQDLYPASANPRI